MRIWLPGIALAITFAASVFAASPGDPWSPDFGSAEGRFLFRFSMQGPLSHIAQSARSQHFSAAQEIPTSLRPFLHSFEVREQARWRSEFYANEKLIFDLPRLSQVREGLLDDLSELPELHGSTFFECYAELKKMSATAAKPADHFTKNLRRLLRLAPFLFDGQGNTKERGALDQRITKIAPFELQALYYDTWRVDLKSSLLGSTEIAKAGQLKMEFLKIDQQFVEKTLLPATRPRTESGEVNVKSQFVLEEVPAAFRAMRSALGQDCSSDTVPYYGWHRDTRLYWIYDSDAPTARPFGYVFVLEIQEKGRTLPYILTINGSNITEQKTVRLVESIATIYGTSEVFLPSSKAEHVVNTSMITDGFSRFKGKETRLKAPSGWTKLEEWSRSAAPAGMEYYNWKDRLDSPRRVKVTTHTTLTALDPVSRYMQPDLKQVSVFAKAKAIADMLKTEFKGRALGLKTAERRFEISYEKFLETESELLKKVDVSQEQIRAAWYLNFHSKRTSVPWEMKAKLYSEAFTSDFSEALATLPSDDGVEFLNAYHRLSPNQLSQAEWKVLYLRLADSLKATVQTANAESWEFAVDALDHWYKLPAAYADLNLFALDPRPAILPADSVLHLSPEAESRILLILSANFDIEGPRDFWFPRLMNLLEISAPDFGEKLSKLSGKARQEFVEASLGAFSQLLAYRNLSRFPDEHGRILDWVVVMTEKAPELLSNELQESLILSLTNGATLSTGRRILELRKSGRLRPAIDLAFYQSLSRLQAEAVDPEISESRIVGRRGRGRRTGAPRGKPRGRSLPRRSRDPKVLEQIDEIARDLMKVKLADGSLTPEVRMELLAESEEDWTKTIAFLDNRSTIEKCKALTKESKGRNRRPPQF